MTSGHSISTFSRIRVVLVCAFVASFNLSFVKGADLPLPLHQEIDRLVAKHIGRSESNIADDAQFLRRVSLDLTGLIPTAADVRDFCHNPSTNKRALAIERLLASPECTRHTQRVIDGWLMRRRPNRNVTSDEWKTYLRQTVLANKHWDQLTTEILKSDGTDPATRAAARFFLDRECNTDDLVRDIGAIFLGRDIRCAQCHDHPIVPDFKQADYFGIAAFVDRSFLLDDKQKQLKVVAEKADGVTAFTSALTQVRGVTAPKIFDGPFFPDPVSLTEQIADALRPEGSQRTNPYSRRALLPIAIVSHPAFGRTLANRLWAMVFGRGIVDPIDQDHGDNPPLHPELLDLLSVRIAEMHYDLKAFLRELVLTDLYARSTIERVESKQALAVLPVRKLTPEQLAWSWLRATGQWDAELRLVQSEMQIADAQRPSVVNEPETTPEDVTCDRLTAEAEKVVLIFTTSLAGEPTRSDTTTEQALFLLNGETLRKWIASRPGNLLDRLMKSESEDQVVDELFVSLLSRQPDSQEMAWIREVLAQSPSNREVPLSDVMEALLTSTEFRFNH